MTRTIKQPISLASEDWVKSMKTHIDVVIKGNRPPPPENEVEVFEDPRDPYGFSIGAATCGEEQ